MKSHFKFSKQKRSGIFLLLLLIILTQYVYFFVDFSSEEKLEINKEELQVYQKEVDSLREVELKEKVFKIYPFNPNYITDYKGYTLGMSNEEIDRLHQFRKTNKWVNSSKEFQTVTKVSDSLLTEISPYFKFPDWVTNPKKKTFNQYSSSNEPKTFEQKIDLNIATALQLQKVNGIGEGFSKRIIDYRNKNQGFISDIELSQIWGLTSEVIARVKEQFIVKTPRKIKTFNLNKASRDELVTIPHIDYEIANSIIEERTLRDGFSKIDDLTKIEQFPLKKLEIIRLYLFL